MVTRNDHHDNTLMTNNQMWNELEDHKVKLAQEYNNKKEIKRSKSLIVEVQVKAEGQTKQTQMSMQRFIPSMMPPSIEEGEPLSTTGPIRSRTSKHNINGRESVEKKNEGQRKDIKKQENKVDETINDRTCREHVYNTIS